MERAGPALKVGGVTLLRAEGGLPEVELTIFEPDALASATGSGERVVRTSVTQARRRLEAFGVTPDLAHQCAGLLRAGAGDRYARSQAVISVLEYLGPVEFFDGGYYDGGPRSYRGVFFELSALALDLGFLRASSVLQALFLVALFSECDLELPITLTVPAGVVLARPSTAAIFGNIGSLGGVLERFHGRQKEPPSRSQTPSAQDLLAIVRSRMTLSGSPATQARLLRLERALSMRERPRRGPLSDPELWQIETRLTLLGPVGVPQLLEAYESAHGQSVDTLYLRARTQFLLGTGEIVKLAQQLSRIFDKAPPGFHELCILTSRAWANAGDSARALSYATLLVEDNSAPDDLRVEAFEIMDDVRSGRPVRRSSLPPPTTSQEVRIPSLRVPSNMAPPYADTEPGFLPPSSRTDVDASEPLASPSTGRKALPPTVDPEATLIRPFPFADKVPPADKSGRTLAGVGPQGQRVSGMKSPASRNEGDAESPKPGGGAAPPRRASELPPRPTSSSPSQEPGRYRAGPLWENPEETAPRGVKGAPKGAPMEPGRSAPPEASGPRAEQPRPTTGGAVSGAPAAARESGESARSGRAAADEGRKPHGRTGTAPMPSVPSEARGVRPVTRESAQPLRRASGGAVQDSEGIPVVVRNSPRVESRERDVVPRQDDRTLVLDRNSGPESRRGTSPSVVPERGRSVEGDWAKSRGPAGNERERRSEPPPPPFRRSEGPVLNPEAPSPPSGAGVLAPREGLPNAGGGGVPGRKSVPPPSAQRPSGPPSLRSADPASSDPATVALQRRSRESARPPAPAFDFWRRPEGASQAPSWEQSEPLDPVRGRKRAARPPEPSAPSIEINAEDAVSVYSAFEAPHGAERGPAGSPADPRRGREPSKIPLEERPMIVAAAPPPRLDPQAKIPVSILRTGRVEPLEQLPIPYPDADGNPPPFEGLPKSEREARIQFTWMARSLAAELRERYRCAPLETEPTAVTLMQRSLRERFPRPVVSNNAERFLLTRHGALLSELLIRVLGGYWCDIDSPALVDWKMFVPPDMEVWPFARVERYILMANRERDLVSYYLELEARALHS